MNTREIRSQNAAAGSPGTARVIVRVNRPRRVVIVVIVVGTIPPPPPTRVTRGVVTEV